MCCGVLHCRHDLDLLVELNVNHLSRGHFQKCRDDCLTAICTALCSPASHADGAADPALVAKSGWQVECGLPHWLRLYHPVLKLQMDVQVCDTLLRCTCAPQRPTQQGCLQSFPVHLGSMGVLNQVQERI